MFASYNITSYHPAIEHALLDVIGRKHEGLNSRFVSYTAAMIGLDY